MGPLMMKERPICDLAEALAYEDLSRALDDTADQPIDDETGQDINDRSLRILVVDDHRATADTMTSLAGVWGHDVRCAYDGTTALALAAAFSPNVILLDLLMPDMSGFEVAMHVRRQDRLKHCFIIAITGRTGASHRRECYEAGADLVLTKPVVPSHMQTLLLLELQHVRSRKKTDT